MERNGNLDNRSAEAAGNSPTRTAAQSVKRERSIRSKQSAVLPGAVFEEIIAVLRQSPAHKNLYISDIEWLVLMPASVRQLKLVRNHDRPLAIVTWAFVSEDVEAVLASGSSRLRPSDWNSGDRPWIVEVIAPALVNDPKGIQNVVAEVAKSAFDGKSFKMRVCNNADSKIQVVDANIGKYADETAAAH